MPPTRGTAEPRGGQLSTAVLAVAAFVVVTTEFLLVGLLPAVARDLGVSVAADGQLVTLFAVFVMLFGPVLTAWLRHIERKRLFIGVLLLFAASNALAAAAPSLWALVLARVAPVLALPVFWGTASETAAQLAGPQRAGRAVATVYLGISGAMLLGIPLGTVAGDAIGWRGAFWVLAGLSLAVALLLQCVMPTMAPSKRVRLAEQARILKDPAFVGNVALSVLVFTAVFTGYTYLAEVLVTVAQLPRAQLPPAQLPPAQLPPAQLPPAQLPPAQVGWLAHGLWCHRPAGQLAGRALGGPRAAGVHRRLQHRAGGNARRAGAGPGRLGHRQHGAVPGLPDPRDEVCAAGAGTGGHDERAAANGGIALGALLGGASIGQWGVGSVGFVGARLALAAAVVVPGVAQLGRGSRRVA